MKNYYAIYGKNGLGIFDDIVKADMSMQYLTKPKIKKMPSKAAAIKLVKERYNLLLQEEFAISGYYNEPDMRLNWLYYRKNL